MATALGGRQSIKGLVLPGGRLREQRDVAYTTWEGWLALDAHERHAGATHRHARERVKLVPRDEQVAISRSGTLARA